jgi:hypothetical protein
VEEVRRWKRCRRQGAGTSGVRKEDWAGKGGGGGGAWPFKVGGGEEGDAARGKGVGGVGGRSAPALVG